MPEVPYGLGFPLPEKPVSAIFLPLWSGLLGLSGVRELTKASVTGSNKACDDNVSAGPGYSDFAWS